MGICGIILLGVGLLFGYAESGSAFQGSISASIALAAAVMTAVLGAFAVRRALRMPSGARPHQRS
jgi:hypothetical protein